MSAPGNQSKKRRGRTPEREKPGYKFWALRILIILICVGAGYLFYLDHVIRSKFEGSKWSLPARVFASPLELYAGRRLSERDLVTTLMRLGYRRSGTLNGAGQFRVSGNAVEFFERAFVIWDENIHEQPLRVEFAGGRIRKITNISTARTLSLVRVEPELIGKVYPDHNEDRILIRYEDIPAFLVAALIAVEDKNFYRHRGIDLGGILRAMYVNFRRGELQQGGSTITQQLVKNFFLSSEKTLWRKLHESLMAVLLERHYAKEEILTAYVNEIYLGQYGARAIHGFGIAAEFYFDRPLRELRKDQFALLAGLVKGASYYNPRRHPDRAMKRRNLVLKLVQKQGVLQESEMTELQSRALDLAASPTWSSAKYPAFIDLVKRQLLRDYQLADLQNEGLKIFTTLEPALQEAARKVAHQRLVRLRGHEQNPQEPLQTAAAVVRISTGEVVVLLGGDRERPGNFNRALDAKRPIGSLIKPAIYLTALSKGDQYNLLSGIDDIPLSVAQQDGSMWQPDNFDHIHHGKVSLLEALKNSYNLASVRLGLDLGLDAVIETLHNMGIAREIVPFPSLLLGSLELSPIEVSQLFQTLANGGFRVPINVIREVLDNDDRPLQRYGLQVQQTLDPDPVFLLNFILTQVTRTGTAKSLQQTMGGITLAGKTGTTNDLRDSWFAGFGDDLMAVVWLGYDSNRPTHFTGATGALQLWAGMMKALNIKPLQMVAPENIHWYRLTTGILRGACPGLEAVPYSGDRIPAPLDSCPE
jgi:penicillin-binding protein 1B